MLLRWKENWEGRAEPTIDPCFARPPGAQKDVQKSAEEQPVK
jgi:hypothetical protein